MNRNNADRGRDRYSPITFKPDGRSTMKSRTSRLPAAILLVIGSQAIAQTPDAKPPRPAVADEKLRQELFDREQKDQAVRKVLLNRAPEEAELQKVVTVDVDNTDWLKKVVELYGWPGNALVGEDGASAAWLLVQHADRDPAFQKKCLGLLAKAVEKNDASSRNLAYLTDRVRVNERKLQIYGTQFDLVDGKLKLKPIEDEQHVDDRRKQAGLEPLSEYLKSAEAALKLAQRERNEQ